MRDKKNGVYVDAGLLRDHVSKLRERKKTASKLYSKVVSMRNSDDLSNAYRYTSILRDIERLVEYFDRMALLLDEMSDDAVEVSHKIGGMLQEDAENTRRVLSKNFML